MTLEEQMGKLYTAQEVADYLGIDRINFYRRIKSGLIKGAKVGKCYKFTVKDIQDYLDRCRN